MYVYEEIINNEKLTDIINTLHENVKYLPGHKLPENVVSISNILISIYFNNLNNLILIVRSVMLEKIINK